MMPKPVLAQLLTARAAPDSLTTSVSLGISCQSLESSCSDVGWDLAHFLYFSLAPQDLDKCPFSRQPKHTPFDLKKATRSCMLRFMYSTHFSRLWLPWHIRQRVDGRGSFWLVSPPVKVTRVLADGGRLMLPLNGIPDPSRYGSLFHSRFKLLGEKIGSVASSASSFTNVTRSLKVITLMVLALVSCVCWHHFMPE